MLSSMFIGYNILNKKSGMKTMQLSVFIEKSEFVVKSFSGQFEDILWLGISRILLGQVS